MTSLSLAARLGQYAVVAILFLLIAWAVVAIVRHRRRVMRQARQRRVTLRLYDNTYTVDPETVQQLRCAPLVRDLERAIEEKRQQLAHLQP